jgi:hypothetical protein
VVCGITTANIPPMNTHAASNPAQRLPVGRVDETLCREYIAVKINPRTTRRRPSTASVSIPGGGGGSEWGSVEPQFGP